MSQRMTIEQEDATDAVLTDLFLQLYEYRGGIIRPRWADDLSRGYGTGTDDPGSMASGQRGRILLQDFQEWGAVVVLEFLASGSMA